MEQITSLPLNEYLVESPFNPRKTFNETELQALADSIKSQGVMQPIVVRPRGMVGDFIEYQIVFGHRRARAARLAGLDAIPVIVRDLDDQTAAIQQTHENSKRENVNAIEEAESFEHLRHVHRLTTDQIAEAVGKSRSYVYGRLKLVKLAPEVRKACLEQDLSPEIALEISRLPHHDLQRAALKACIRWSYTGEGKVADGWIPTREAERQVRYMFKLDLNEAPFDVQDASLNAERGTCSGCPKRAGNDPAYEGIVDPMICLDEKCHTIKVDAHLAKLLAKAKKSGQTVIEAEQAKALLPHSYSMTPNGYTRLSQDAYYNEAADGEESSEVSFEQALQKAGKKAPKVTLVVDPHKPGKVIPCITNEQAEQLLKDLGIEEVDGHDTTPAWRREQDAAEAAELAALSPADRALRKDWEAIFAVAFQRAAAATSRQGGELLFICRSLMSGVYDLDDRLLDAMGWREEVQIERDAGSASKWEDEEHWAFHKLAECTTDQLAKFAVLSALLGVPNRYESDDAAIEKRGIAALYSVNPLDPSAEVQAPADASTPSTAARARGKAKAVASEKTAKAAPAAKKPKTKSKGEEQKDDAGVAGGSGAQFDMLEEAGA